MRTLTVCLTRRCNMRCIHCYVNAGEAYPDELTASELVALFRQAADLGFGKIDFFGGEPLLRKDLVEFCAACRHLGLETSLMTNGVLLDENKLSKLARAGLGTLFISMYGNQSAHQTITQCKDGYHKALQAISLAARSDIRIGVSTCVNTINFFECESLALEMAERGARVHVFLYFSPIGRAGSKKHLALNAVQWNTLKARLALLNACNPNLHLYIEPSFARWPAKNEIVGQCEAMHASAKTLVTVDADGRVYPCCLLMNSDQCSVGHIRQEPLQAILRRYAENTDMIRGNALPLACQTCDKLADCGGGCLAYASPGAPDHRCMPGKPYQLLCPLLFVGFHNDDAEILPLEFESNR